MCQRQHRPGFTLRELFAVIIIVALLLGLLLPALKWSGGGGRRDTCSNNMRNISYAMLNYEELHRRGPGYANVVNDKRASWVVPLLPHIEQFELYRVWTDVPAEPLPLPTGSSNASLEIWNRENPWPHARVSVLICPSNTNQQFESNTLSYVVNCGSARTANDFFPPATDRYPWVEDRNSGVFFNRARADLQLETPSAAPPATAFAADSGPVVTLSFIGQHDGAGSTLVLSENLQATTWATDPTDTKHQPPYPFQSEFQIKQNTGFVWFVTGNKDNAGPAPATAVYNQAAIAINGLKDAPTPVPQEEFSVRGISPPTGGLAYARPSSNHPGGVNVVFADGHLHYLSEDIDYKVYTQLMTPNGSEAIVSLPEKGAQQSGWDYQLREEDY